MLTVTSAQLDTWIAAFIFPLARILGLLATAPVFSNAVFPMQMRVILGLTISIAMVPALPAMPTVTAGSWLAMAMLAEQTLLGILMGFSLQAVFAAIDVAGEQIGMQMGLSFATSYDPQSAGQTPVVTEFIALLTTLIFLASNGHLLILSVLAESFTLLPVTTTPFAASALQAVLATGTTLFSFGLLLALPLIAALLITNIGLGVLARVAPQLNLFAVGFAVSIVTGLFVLTLSLPYIGAALERLFDQSFMALGLLLKASRVGALPVPF